MTARRTPAHPRTGRWPRSVRTRLTVLATVLVAVGLTVAAVCMIVMLRHILLLSANAATYGRAHQIASVLATNGIDGVDPALLTTGQYISLIQIVDADGKILLTNDWSYDRPQSEPLSSDVRRTIHGAHADATDTEFQTTALGAPGPGGPFTIMVGAPEESINLTVATVAILCSILFPLIVIGVAMLTWMLVGRALRPVTAIGQRVTEISGGDLSQRVPVPRSGDEIAALADTMNAMLGRIETARTRQLQFVNDASHEFNSPLTTLVGLLDLSRTKQTPLEPDVIETVMLPDALRLQQMVADLLLLARADENGVPLRCGTVDLDEIVSAEVARTEAITNLHVDAHIVAVRITGDAEKLGRALRNIADNAVRHAASTVTFDMTIDHATKTATVAVLDDGLGIADADKTRVLQRFVRLDPARGQQHPGSGLGLSIVAEIVDAHGGQVAITDRPGGGTAVTLTFPVAAQWS